MIIIVITSIPPNLVTSLLIISRKLYYEYYDDFSSAYGEGVSPLTYASWMGFCVPLMVVNTFLAWLWIVLLKKIYSRGQKSADNSDQDGKVAFLSKIGIQVFSNMKVKKVIREKRAALGKINSHEIQVSHPFCQYFFDIEAIVCNQLGLVLNYLPGSGALHHLDLSLVLPEAKVHHRLGRLLQRVPAATFIYNMETFNT